MERIRHKIGRIREHIELITSIKDECTERFVSDPIYRGALLHYSICFQTAASSSQNW